MAPERLGEGGEAPAVVGVRTARRREPPAGAEDEGAGAEDAERGGEEEHDFCDEIRGNRIKR